MALRCLLFSSDEKIAPPICQALAGLGIEAEHCAAAVEAVGKVTTESFQIVIVDWDNQPEAGLLLSTARQRKAAERPLTLAVVSNDANVPQALQAGANSILRKPIQPNQVRDTLTTARDLLRSRLDSAVPATNAAAAAAAQSAPAASRPNDNPSARKTLRAGEFLHAVTGPGAQFDIESDAKNSFGHVTASEIDALEELEPMAASVESKEVVPAPVAPGPSEPRGLSWYLNARAGTLPPDAAQPAAPSQAELLSYDQTPTHNEVSPVNISAISAGSGSAQRSHESDQKTEAALFAYMSGQSSEGSEPARTKASPWLRKALIPVAVVAVCGIIYVGVPRSFWRQKGRSVLSYIAHTGHNWLNPQTPTPAQAPASHENFGRAGDEYKLPVAENIPDATTDPSQIRIVPVLDPTAKVDPNAKQAAAADNTDLAAADTAADGANTGDQSQAPPVQVQENPPAQPPPNNLTADQPVSVPSQASLTSATGEPAHTDTAPAQTVEPAPRTRVQPVSQKNSTPHAVSTAALSGIPSSLKSQIASMTPEASGNKPPEAALPSIEPVQLPEAAARSLLLQQAEPVYPETAKGQKGTVVLQVLIGRDGTVQDAKFLQGSLAFARAAIDAVKQWRFKPFTMNGRPASAQTLLTLNFRPGA